MATIADRIPRVRKRLGNRSDADSRILDWLRDAYIELGNGYCFAELEDYFEDAMIVGQDIYDYPTMDTLKGSIHDTFLTRAIRSLTVVLQSGSRIPLRRKSKKTIDVYSVTNGTPAVYCSYAKQIIVRQPPNYAFTLKWSVWVKPQITADIFSTEILLPDDWLEILDLSAAMRGHADLGEPEKAQQAYEQMHGGTDPSTGRRWPGLIQQRKNLAQMEVGDEDYSFDPRVRSYT